MNQYAIGRVSPSHVNPTADVIVDTQSNSVRRTCLFAQLACLTRLLFLIDNNDIHPLLTTGATVVDVELSAAEDGAQEELSGRVGGTWVMDASI